MTPQASSTVKIAPGSKGIMRSRKGAGSKVRASMISSGLVVARIDPLEHTIQPCMRAARAMGVVVESDRPVASTMRTPAASHSAIALITRLRTTPSPGTSVPSTSMPIRWGKSMASSAAASKCTAGPASVVGMVQRYYARGVNDVCPPRKGCRALGMRTDPSAC